MKFIIKYQEGDDYYCDVNKVLPVEAPSKEFLEQKIKESYDFVGESFRKYREADALLIPARTQLSNQVYEGKISRESYNQQIEELHSQRPVVKAEDPIFNILYYSLQNAKVVTLEEWFEEKAVKL